MSGKGVKFSITASDKTKTAFNGVQTNIRKTAGLQRSWNAGLNSNRRAVQQFGFQMTDFATQVAGGQSAMLAFTQQGGQMLQFFGPGGAIAAAFLAVFGSLAIAFTRSGAALSDLTPILGVLQDDFSAISRGLVVVRELMIDFANVVLNNMDHILITLTLVASFMATKWVYAFVKARIATFTLVGAMDALSGALIRTGIGALIVGTGYLVYKFTQLVKGAGSFGNAMSLLRDVVVEVWGRIGEAASVYGMRVSAAWDAIEGSIYVSIQGVFDNVEWLSNRIIGSFVGAYKAVVAVWNVLPQAFTNLGTLAVNALVGILEKGLTAVTSGVNKFLDALHIPTIDPPDFSSWKSVVPKAADIGNKAAAAFSDGFNQTYVGDGKTGGVLGQLGSDLINGSKITNMIADSISGKLDRPIKSWQALRDAMKKADDEGKNIDIRDWFKGGDKGSGGGGGGGPIPKLADMAKKIKDIFDGMSKTISSALSSAFKGLLDGTKTIGQAVQGILASVLEKMTDIMMQPVWDRIAEGASTWMLGGSSGGGSGWFGKILKSFLSFDGGGYTGGGSRSGGIDGKGGGLAILHPNETVVDHSRRQRVSGGSNMRLDVHIHENAREDKTEVRQSSGRVDVFLRRMVVDTISDGGADKAISSRFGLRPQASGG